MIGMPLYKSFDKRTIKLNSYLRNTMHPLTLDEIVERLIEELELKSLDKRTVQNDLTHLIKAHNAPIIKKKIGKKTVWLYDDTNWSIDKLHIDNDEVNLIQSALDIIIALKTFKLSDSLKELVVKLKQEATFHTVEQKQIIQFEANENTQGLHLIDDVYEAIKGETVIKITYQRFVAEKERKFVLHPYLLKEYRNRWYVIGLVADKNDIATFALDRIKKIKPLLNSYKPNSYFDPTSYFDNLIGISRQKKDKPETIVLIVNKQQLPYFKTQPLHHTQEITNEYKDGSALLQYRLIINFELKQLLLSYAGFVDVVKPVGLKDEIKELLEKHFLK